MTRPRPELKLPLRDGVAASCVALPPGPWVTVLAFLVQRFERVPPEEWRRRLLAGEVLDEAGQAVAVDQAYQAPCRLYYFRQPPPELAIPFQAQVLYRDARILVADKPHFLPVVPSGRYLRETLLVRLRQQLGLDALVPLHRIDQDTAGLVLFSLDPASRGAYAALFRERAVHKAYDAVAPWRADLRFPLDYQSRLVPGTNFMTMTEADGEPNAFTRIALLESQGDWARYRLEPRTGQRHQLRVQMAALGLPLRHDRIYPDLMPERALDQAPDYQRPLQLLARELAFTDPVSGQALRFESRLRLLPL